MVSGYSLILVCVLLTAFLYVTVTQASQRSDFCGSPQTGVIGVRGIIRCNVEPGFVGVYWFDERNERTPLIRYENDIIHGQGQLPKEYNILANGSLVINEVSRKHEGLYKLVVIDGQYSDFEEEIQFNVIGIVTTHQNYSTYQGGEFGEKAIIKWNIPRAFEGVYWFDNPYERDPIVRYEAGVKSGRLYQLEYDICDNGSLVINNVTSKYDGKVFKLIVVDSNYREQVAEIHFSVFDPKEVPHTTERTLATVLTTKTSSNSSHPPQHSQSHPQPPLHTENTTPPNLQTSIALKSSRAYSVSSSVQDNIHGSTEVETTMTSFAFSSSTSCQSTTPSADYDGNNGSHRRLSCQYLQFLLLLYFVVFHV